jgi:hypothetical protein
VRLLEIYDEKVQVYCDGAKLFRDKAFLATGDSLSSTPLEAAYVWTLAVRLAYHKFIEFGSARFRVEPTVDIVSSRLFSNSQVNKPDIENINALRKDVLYYAEEKGGLKEHPHTHPRVDIWFRTTRDQVILIDVAGGSNIKHHQAKVKNLQGLIDDWNKKPELTGLKFEGVVLAPAIPGPSPHAAAGEVHRVLGSDARRLLGGLDQVFRWFESEPVNSKKS